jgi:hypothetical protein
LILKGYENLPKFDRVVKDQTIPSCPLWGVTPRKGLFSV